MWSVGLGTPGQHERNGKFNGHAVCTVPSLSLLIDTTLYQSIRPAWAAALTGMMAIPYEAPGEHLYFKRHPFAGAGIDLSDGRHFNIVWLDRPELRWKRNTDFEKSPRRRAVTRALIERFGEWTDE